MNEAKIEILVLEAQAGRRSAMGELYNAFYDPMRKYALLRVGDAMIAEDLVHNVWLHISKRVQQLRDVSLFRSWLFRALRWQIIDWQRMSSKEVVSAVLPDSAEEASLLQDSVLVLPMLKELTHEDREVVELFYLNDMSVREIALIISVPIGTVKSRLHRARAQLKHKIVNLNQGAENE